MEYTITVNVIDLYSGNAKNEKVFKEEANNVNDLIKKYENSGYDILHDYGHTIVLYKDYHNGNEVEKIYIERKGD